MTKKNVEITTSQAGKVVDHIAVSLHVQGEAMSAAIDDPSTEEVGSLIEDFEQTVHLRNLIIDKTADRQPAVWECPDDDCAWLSPNTEELCQQCGEPKPQEA